MSSSSQTPDTSKTVLRLIPLDDTVVMPSMGITLTVDVGEDDRVVLVPRHDNEFLEVGTIAEVSDRVRLPGGGRAVALSGVSRALIGAAQTGPGGELRVEVEERPDEVPVDRRTRELEREYRAIVEEILKLRGDDGRIAAFLRAIVEPGALADSAGYSPNLTYDQKVELLRTINVTDRLKLAVKLQRESLAELQVRKRIRERTSRRVQSSSSASTSCASRWSRSARSWAKMRAPSQRNTGRRSTRRRCLTRCASRL